jgi:hypothetical protein
MSADMLELDHSEWPELSFPVLSFLQKAQELQRCGELSGAAEAFEAAIKTYKTESKITHPVIATARSYLAGILSEIGYPERAKVMLAAARRDWEDMRGPERVFWCAFCSQIEAGIFRQLGRSVEALSAGQISLKSFRALLLGFGDLEQAVRTPDLSPEDASYLIRAAVAFASSPTAGLLDFVTMLALTVVRGCVVVALALHLLSYTRAPSFRRIFQVAGIDCRGRSFGRQSF